MTHPLQVLLLLAVIIAAGLDGIERGLTLAAPVEESLFEMDAARIAACVPAVPVDADNVTD